MSDKLDFKAFEDGKADELLRETMAGHRAEPDPRLWKDISRKLLLKELLHFNFTNLSPKFWMAGTAGLLLIATAIYLGIPVKAPESSSLPATGNFTPVAFSANSTVNLPQQGLLSNSKHKSVENSVAANPISPEQSLGKSAKPQADAEQKQLGPAQDIRSKTNELLLLETGFISRETAEVHETSLIDNVTETAAGITHIIPFETALLLITPRTDTIITISNSDGIQKFRKNTPGANQFFSANLGITPEIAFYAEPAVYSKSNFWLDGGVTYHISRFSIASGFSLGYVYDEGKYNVEYKSHDSVGYFTGVISYTVGSNNEIIYNTQTVRVYDSLQHLDDYRTKSRYSYLQVPLLLGYRLFETNKVSLTFQVGPALSILLGSRKSDPVIEYSNARIIRVDDATPTRIETNWQIWTNLYFEMRMNKLVSIYLEPSFKFSLKPMVTQENVKYKAPWTIGLGVGLQFNFGQKKKTP